MCEHDYRVVGQPSKAVGGQWIPKQCVHCGQSAHEYRAERAGILKTLWRAVAGFWGWSR